MSTTPFIPLPMTVPLARVWRRAGAVLSIAFAVALTLCLQGYQFGKSNHTVYLLDALRHVSPDLLNSDWFATQTFQYHALFGMLTRALMTAGILAPAFLVGYLILVVAMHVAWWRIVRTLGGGAAQFLVSQVLFQLLAAGVGLGMYMFLQDSCFLPGNISAVALLCAIALWLEARPLACAFALAIAGAFHLNCAPVVILLWMLLQACDVRRRSPSERFTPRFFIASAVAIVPAALNIAFAFRGVVGRSDAMPLAQFVDLYVFLRHPHHYNPSSWPMWLWLAFAAPIPPAIFWWVRNEQLGRGTDATQYAARIFFIFSLLAIVALIGAGVTYFSEQLIQASLYRFSVFVKMLACVGTAFFICEIAARYKWQSQIAAAAVGMGLMLMLLCLRMGPYVGLYGLSYEDPKYEAACDWIRDHTPVDAIFIVPPHEQEFRLRAHRAIVVNFKGVPQLSRELIEWRDRLEAVLDLPDLDALPHPYAATLKAMRDRYHEVEPMRLAAAAEKYRARYIVSDHNFGSEWEPLRVDMDGNRAWLLYDLFATVEGGRRWIPAS